MKRANVIAVSIARIDYETACAFIDRYKLIELRLDLLDWSISQINEYLNRAERCIITCRAGDHRRTEFFQGIDWNSVFALDLDIANDQSFLDSWTRVARAAQVRLIYSHHDYEKFIDPEDFLRKHDRLLDKADYVKLASICSTELQVEKYIAYQKQYSTCLFIAMGNKGVRLRKWAPLLGAPWTYAFPANHTSTAPGQVCAEDLSLFLESRTLPSRLHAVIGNPISHSKSPVIFNSYFRKRHLTDRYIRLVCDSPSELNDLDFLPLDIVNVTAPYKHKNIWNAPQKKPKNTIDLRGALVKYGNSDPIGISRALKGRMAFTKRHRVLVIGSGGAAYAACAALESEDHAVFLCARNEKAVRRLLSDFPAFGMVSWTQLQEEIDLADLVIWTVPASVAMDKKLRFSSDTWVLDAHYKQGLTAYVDLNEDFYIPGADWLRYQSIPTFHRLGLRLGVEKHLKSLSLRSRETPRNIALVGMPAAGKSHVGTHLSALMAGYAYSELDQLIEKDVGLSIPEIFARKGDQFFRERESSLLAVLCDAVNEKPLLLSTGGGVVVRPENRALLTEHFFVVWLVASPLLCAERSGRDRPLIDSASPLSSFRRLHRERYWKYAEVCDLAISVKSKSGRQIAQKIYEEYNQLR